MSSNDNIVEYGGIIIDLGRDRDIPEQGLTMLTKKGFYKKSHEDSPQQSFARAATCYSFGDYEFAQRIYDYRSKGWFTFASPVQTNAVDIEWPTFTEDQFSEAADWLEENVEPDGMPISCFLSFVGDTKEQLLQASTETRRLSMAGGGLGVMFANRSPDEKSTGVLAHMKGYDADALAYKQTESRRGSIATYLDIDHPEIINFIQARNPVGGDFNRKTFNLNNAVNVPDSFMEAVIRGEDYELVDPKHGPTGRFLSAREVWEDILELRKDTGEPYINFTDTVNRNLPSQIMNPTYHVRQSNLCSEITLMTNLKRTAVCCLSSLNLAKYDEWKDTSIVEDLIRFLDNVLEYFIRLAPMGLERAVRSASKERALGLGTLGYHSYLQSKGIPFESGGFGSAVQVTEKIFSSIKSKAEKESIRLAEVRGEAPDCVGSGYRNSHLLAIAPNASTADLVGESAGIEPYKSNAYLAQGRAGSFIKKNKYLEEALEGLGLNTQSMWKRIMKDDGSVQNIDEIPDELKKVFKTFKEISPEWIIELASIRQKYLCQSQSLNIYAHKDITKQEMSDIHLLAWAKGVKTLYYCRSESANKAKLGDGGNKPLNSVPVKVDISFDGNECLGCDG